MSKSEETATNHWETYVKMVVETAAKCAAGPGHNAITMTIDQFVETIGKHYIATFIHGYKHCQEDTNKILDTVKKWYNAQLGCQVDPQDIRELGEILEAGP